VGSSGSVEHRRLIEGQSDHSRFAPEIARYLKAYPNQQQEQSHQSERLRDAAGSPGRAVAGERYSPVAGQWNAVSHTTAALRVRLDGSLRRAAGVGEIILWR